MHHRFIIYLLLSLLVQVIWAQEEAIMDCHYALDYRPNLDKKTRRKDEMVLRLSRSSSMFFSRWCWERQAIKDSLFSRGASLGEVMDAIERSGYPLSTLFTIIYKDYPQEGVFTTTDILVSLDLICTEDRHEPQWEISEEKQEILGYNCQKAVAQYYGREWTVWFTTEIPFSDGPWKLHGLPGLILQAEDAAREFIFTCIELRETKASIAIAKKKYIVCSKDELDKLEIEYRTNDTKFRKKRDMPYAKPVSEEPGYLPPDRIFNYIER